MHMPTQTIPKEYIGEYILVKNEFRKIVFVAKVLNIDSYSVRNIIHKHPGYDDDIEVKDMKVFNMFDRVWYITEEEMLGLIL